MQLDYNYICEIISEFEIVFIIYLRIVSASSHTFQTKEGLI